MSNAVEPTEHELAAALESVQASIDRLSEDGKEREALELAMQRLDIARRYYGESSLQYHDSKVSIAEMLLKNAAVLNARAMCSEACELLLHADSLTRDPIVALPSSEFLRQLTRLSMDKEATTARYKQQRFRSAVSYSKQLISVAERLHAVWELPVAWLNYSAALSAAHQHTKALGASYQAYQVTAAIVTALTAERAAEAAGVPQESIGPSSRYLLAALRLEAAALTRDHQAIADALKDCHSARDRRDDGHAETPGANAADANITDDLVRLPAASKQRWGGILALIYRSIACEQEHLGQQGAAALTHRVGASTAETCLGPDHFVTLQCKAAQQDSSRMLGPASSSSHNGQSKAAALRGLPPGRRGQARAVDRVPGASGAPIVPTTIDARTSASNRRGASAGNRSRSTADGDHVPQVKSQPRPLWNGWFSSADTPPAHLQAERLARPTKFIARPRPASSTHAPSESRMSSQRRVGESTQGDDSRSGERAHHATELSAHDREYLRNTYRVPARLALPRPLSVDGTTRTASVQDARYYELLEEHRRFAAELARELGL